MPADKYAFDEVDTDELAAAVRKLRSSQKSKDVIAKGLKEVADVLQKFPQDVQALGPTAKQLVGALAQKAVLQHTDKDVKLYAAYCAAQLLRIYAPDVPYEDKRIQLQVFNLLLWAIRRVAEAQAPTFELAVSTLQLISQTKSYLLMLDLEEEDVVLDWMRGLLECINEGSHEMAEGYVAEVLTGILDEEDYNDSAVEIILAHLVAPKKEENPAAYRVAHRVIQRSERVLKVPLQKFLTTMILSPITSNSDLHAQCYALVYEVYQLVPQVLLPVIPHLTAELQADDEAKRLEAVQLLGKLFSLPSSSLATDFGDVLQEFLRRYHDQKVSIRLEMLKATPALAKTAGVSPTLHSEVMQAATERLQDFDEKVRIGAIKAVCEAALAAGDNQSASSDTLVAVSLRLRDTKLAVRKQAASSLLGVFRKSLAQASSPLHFRAYWILSRLLLCSRADMQLRQYVLEVLCKDGVLPASLDHMQQATAWVALFMEAAVHERDAMLTLMGLRAKLQSDLIVFLELRRIMSNKDAPYSQEQVLAKLGKAAKTIAAQLPDAGKAEAGLEALRDVKDNKVIAALLSVFGFGVSQEAAAASLKDVLQRVGSKTPLADFIHTLVAWGAPSCWIPKEVASALLQLLLQGGPGADAAGSDQEEQQEAADRDSFVAGALSFAQALSKAAPTAFSGLAPLQLELMDSLLPELQVLGAQLLARAAKRSKLKSSEKLSKQMPKGLTAKLKGLAEEGPMKAAKAAVLALASVLEGGAVEKELSALCSKLAGEVSTKPGSHTAAKLQAISSIGRSAPAAFAPHAEQLVSFVLDEYLDAEGFEAEADPALRPGPSSLSQGSMFSGSQLSGPGGELPKPDMALKAAALKAMARACVPDAEGGAVPADVGNAAAGYMLVLERLTEPAAELPALEGASAIDGGCLRLAAAAGMLRLARRLDGRLTPSSYCALSLMMQDMLEEVRAQFTTKLMALVRYFQSRPYTHQLAAKYAAMLPLAGMDPSPANKAAAARLLRDFVALRRRTAQQAITAAAGGGAGGAEGGSTLQEQPEMMLPYTIYILAHHPDFPEDEADLEGLQPFQYMLQFLLSALLAPANGEPAAASLPIILKLLRYLKRTEDTLEEPCNQQLYMLCDMAAANAMEISERLLKKTPQPGRYPGSIILPKGLFRAMENNTRGAKDVSHLPPGFSVVLDPQPPASAGNSPEPAAAKRRTAAAGAHGTDNAPAKGKGAVAGKGEDEVEEKDAGNRGSGRSKQAAARRKGAGRAAKKRSAADEWGSVEDASEGSQTEGEDEDEEEQQQQHSAGSIGAASPDEDQQAKEDKQAQSRKGQKVQQQQRARRTSAGGSRLAAEEQEEAAAGSPAVSNGSADQQQKSAGAARRSRGRQATAGTEVVKSKSPGSGLAQGSAGAPQRAAGAKRGKEKGKAAPAAAKQAAAAGGGGRSVKGAGQKQSGGLVQKPLAFLPADASSPSGPSGPRSGTRGGSSVKRRWGKEVDWSDGEADEEEDAEEEEKLPSSGKRQKTAAGYGKPQRGVGKAEKQQQQQERGKEEAGPVKGKQAGASKGRGERRGREELEDEGMDAEGGGEGNEGLEPSPAKRQKQSRANGTRRKGEVQDKEGRRNGSRALPNGSLQQEEGEVKRRAKQQAPAAAADDAVASGEEGVAAALDDGSLPYDYMAIGSPEHKAEAGGPAGEAEGEAAAGVRQKAAVGSRGAPAAAVAAKKPTTAERGRRAPSTNNQGDAVDKVTDQNTKVSSSGRNTTKVASAAGRGGTALPAVRPQTKGQKIT